MVVTSAQFRIALDDAGLFAAFDAQATANARLIRIWEYNSAFRRNSGFIAAMTSATFTEAVLDALFRAAMIEDVQ